jgi:hypothetical protein
VWRLLLAGALLLAGFTAGWQVQAWRHGAAETKATAHTARVAVQQGAANTVAAAHDAQVQTDIRWRTRIQIKEVPVYVTAETDRRFPLPVGLVRLHDASALGLDLSAVPDPAGRADGEASAVAASDLGRVVAANYGECRADQARLTELQDWVDAQAKALGVR